MSNEKRTPGLGAPFSTPRTPLQCYTQGVIHGAHLAAHLHLGAGDTADALLTAYVNFCLGAGIDKKEIAGGLLNAMDTLDEVEAHFKLHNTPAANSPANPS